VIKASCLCGEVRLKIVGEISDIIHCHCGLCRKSSGTAFATNGFVQTNDLTITHGENQLQSFELRPGKKRHFCQRCGSPIYSSNAQDKSRLRLRLGTLDNAIVERPASHNFIASKADWHDLGVTLPHYPQHEPNRSKPTSQ